MANLDAINYKGKDSHIADTDTLLPDNLNRFFASFEEKIQCCRGPPLLTRTVSSRSLWLT